MTLWATTSMAVLKGNSNTVTHVLLLISKEILYASLQDDIRFRIIDNSFEGSGTSFVSLVFQELVMKDTEFYQTLNGCDQISL